MTTKKTNGYRAFVSGICLPGLLLVGCASGGGQSSDSPEVAVQFSPEISLREIDYILTSLLQFVENASPPERDSAREYVQEIAGLRDHIFPVRLPDGFWISVKIVSSGKILVSSCGDRLADADIAIFIRSADGESYDVEVGRMHEQAVFAVSRRGGRVSDRSVRLID